MVIDNNSSDSTSKIFQTYKDQELKYFLETNQGLSHARNRGWKEASGDYVAYIDDDAKVDTNWFTKLLDVIEKEDPDVIGGPIYPYYTSSKPKWWKEEYEIRLHQNYSGELESINYISGSNMIFKRDIFTKFGGFNVELGMNGKNIGYYEEGELLDRIRNNNIKTYYCLELKVEHWVNPYKFTIDYLIQFIKGERKVHKLKNKKAYSFFKIMKSIVRLFIYLIYRDRNKFPFLMNLIKEEYIPFFIRI